MKTVVKFKAIVSDHGTIQVPESHHLENEEVEVIIVSDEVHQSQISGSTFVDRWAGFLSVNNVEDAKADYLSKKYK